MAEFVVKERRVALHEEWEVIVVGGGPAGCAAAAAAAREGARTLLIEATGALGGMGTSGLVPAWCPFTDKERIIHAGLAERVLRETMAGMPHVPADRFDWTPIDPERLKRVYDDLVTGFGAVVLFNTVLTGVEEGPAGAADTLLCAGKAGLAAYRAPVYVDCTGDGDLAAWAGAPYEQGDADGELQPATHCFVLANVDVYAYEHIGGIKYHPKRNLIDQIVASGRYPEIPDTHACNNLIGPGTVGFNAGHLWEVDNTDPLSVSRAMIRGRRLARAFRDACAEFFPEAFANSFLAATGSLMGVRESRRILGDYYLTVDDFRARRSFADEICRNCYFVDVHPRQGEPHPESEESCIHLGKGESHGIPYRCLTPRELRNVLVAGRSISTDRAVQGSTRVMPVCLCTGEAAGLAAALAAGSGGDVRAVEPQQLRARLRQVGAYLP
ncbi:MAG: FAD-dependent oxidoreductase [Candidatus Latescibacterota bacterium]|jgi:hypothetical protein